MSSPPPSSPTTTKTLVIRPRQFGERDVARPVQPYFEPVLCGATTILAAMFLLRCELDPVFSSDQNETVAGPFTPRSWERMPAFWRFFSAWAAMHLFGIFINLRGAVNFFRWWKYDSRFGREQYRRGFSTFGYPLFGILPVPALNPYPLFWICCGLMLALIACVMYPCPTTARVAFVFFFFWAGNLWAFRPLSYHREVVSMVVLIYASLGNDQDASVADLSLALLRVHCATIYFWSVVQKCACSVMRGRFWCFWSPHFFAWKSMWCKGYWPGLQKFLFLRPKIFSLMGLGSFVLEGAPMFAAAFLPQNHTFALDSLALLLPPVVYPATSQIFPEWLLQLPIPTSALVSAMMLTFHLSVVFVQGIDYVTFLAVAQLSGFVTVTANAAANDTTLQVVWRAYVALYEGGLDGATASAESVCAAASLLFLAAQVIYCVGMLENWNINLPPLMSCPMFITVMGMSDKDAVNSYVISEENRSSIAVERLEWMTPMATFESAMSFPVEDVDRIPFPFVTFGWRGGIKDMPAVVSSWFLSEEEFPVGFYVYSNVALSKEFLARAEAFVREMHVDIFEQEKEQGEKEVRSPAEQAADLKRQERRWRKSSPLHDPYSNLHAVYDRHQELKNLFHSSVTRANVVSVQALGTATGYEVASESDVFASETRTLKKGPRKM